MVVAEEAEVAEAEEETAFIENPHDDGFAVIGGDGGDPEVDVLGADAGLDTAVLRDAAFVDAHGTRHDFETGHDGGMEVLGVTGDLLEDPVDAVADAESFFERFDVDVTGAGDDCFGEQFADHADDGGVGFGDDGGCFGTAEAETAVGFLLVAEELGEVLSDLGFGGAVEVEREADEVRQTVHGLEVQGVGDSDGETAAFHTDGDDVVFDGGFCRH